MLRLFMLAGLCALAVGAFSPAHAQTGTCAAEVRKLQSSPELRVQGGTSNQVTTRAGAVVYLQAAAQAAKQNDEKLCRLKLNEAKVAMSM